MDSDTLDEGTLDILLSEDNVLEAARHALRSLGRDQHAALASGLGKLQQDIGTARVGGPGSFDTHWAAVDGHTAPPPEDVRTASMGVRMEQAYKPPTSARLVGLRDVLSALAGLETRNEKLETQLGSLIARLPMPASRPSSDATPAKQLGLE